MEVRSLEKAASILRSFTAKAPEWGVRDLAAHLSLARATTHAYLSSLAAAGFLRRTSKGRYRLSWNLAELGAELTASLPWFTPARTALADLALATNSLGFLCVLEDARVVCINRALGDPDAPPDALQTDFVLPANATIAGKILYAHADLPPPTFVKFTPSTITTLDEWQGELARVRQQGFAHAVEEWISGYCALGVPLVHDGDVVAAIGVQLPTSRFLSRERSLLARVRRAAEQAVRSRPRPTS
ncbi:IclR family transcriptional regulator [Deinococcus yavapaiensis]|uniref:IclR family transcriptional regulator n=1 Tax=Deinococcus yavapaiensis KR-236 TaxID=694435 RepID=A0A318SA75_9DEIO|nr:IclR family transcriptional regulator [Deinococcus yavapaiensis]PYE53134.1 IclR family transcriptional regulator [Deinococcus yavapaiensis KR-236]